MVVRASVNEMRFYQQRFIFSSFLARVFACSAIGLASFQAGAVCSYSGTKNQEGSLKHDGINLYRCDSGNSWENLGALSLADNLGNHTATQNLILGSYYLSGDGGNEGVYVDASGNVGIGTTNPGYKLEVVGSTKIGVPINNGLLIQENDGTTLNAFLGPSGFGGFAMGTQSNDNVILFSNNSERMRVTSSGNVGIGTTNPGAKLEVSGSSILLNNGSSNADIYLGSNTNGGRIDWDNNNSRLSLGYNNTNYITISSGNVGIGTTTPSEKLEVNGNIKMGRERVATSCNPATSCSVDCTAGKQVIGGGCAVAAGSVMSNYPNSDTSWFCGNTGVSTYIAVYAICANIK